MHGNVLASVTVAGCIAAAAGGTLACVASDPEGQEPVAAGRAAVLHGSYDSGDRAVVALTGSTGNVICTGTLISSRIVLTAGHCTYGFTPYYAYFGTSTPFQPGGQVRVSKAIPHPDYDPSDFRRADLGVVVLRDRAPAEPREWNASPIDGSFVGRDIRIVGFGFQQPEAEPERRIGDKMTVYLPILQLVGEKEYEYVLGTCNGDSGGPQFFVFPDGVERVIGVTSYGRDGCTGTSGAHRVDPYDAWIGEQIALHDPPSCELDYRCVNDCAEVDPDCPCSPDDGKCAASCADPAADPDCPPGCGAGDQCVHACPAPDPDCGDPCVAEGHCVKDCPVRDPDCPTARVLGADCTIDFDCQDGSLCLTPVPARPSVCTPTCDPAGASCGSGLECRRVSLDTSACLPPLRMIQGFREPGCTLAPAARSSRSLSLALVGLVLAFYRAHRRRARAG